MPEETVPEELRNAALSRFQPLVFTLVTRHPQHVHLPSIVEGLQREPALAGHLYTIDTRQLIRECVTGGKQGGARGRPAAPDAAAGNNSMAAAANNNNVSSSSMRRINAQNDAARTAAAELREAYVRIAVAREVARREREAARVRALEELYAQYIEDGFGEADARQAAERDWHESEAAAKDGSSDDSDDDEDEGGAARGEVRWADSAGPRPERPLFVCILDYPNSLLELGELHRVGVPLSVVVELRSKIPLTGSELYLVDDAAGAGAGAANAHASDRRAANKEDRNRASVRRTRAADEGIGGGGGGGALVAQLQARSEARTVLECTATDEVLLFTYEFGAALEQALAGPGSPPAAAALLTLSAGRPYGAQEAAMVQRLERSGRAALTQSLRQLARRWRHFCLWRQQRVLCGVPRCATIADVKRAAAAQSAPATDPAGTDKAAERGSARRTTLTPRRSTAVSAAVSPGGTPPLTPLPPPVVATGSAAERGSVAAGDTSRELTAPLLLRAMAQLACDREAYAQYIDSCQQARLEHGTPETSTAQRVRDFAWAALHAATAAAAPPAGVTTAANPIDAMRRVRDAAELFCRQLFCDVVGPVARTGDGEPTGAVSDVTGPARDGAARSCAGAGVATAHPASRTTRAAVADDLRQTALAMWRRDGVASGADADLEAAFATALLSRGDVRDGGRRGLLQRHWLAYKNAQGWQHESTRWHDGYEVHLLHRPTGGVARTQHTSYSFEGPTTFPEFVALLEYCERAWAHYHPPPPDSDASATESEGDDEGSTSDDEAQTGAAATAAIPPPLPCVDHAARVAALLRRRRDYEAVRRALAQPCLQELGSGGAEGQAATSARVAVEELQWLSCADGVVIEAERTCANTRQLACHVLPPSRGIECGFLFDDPIAPSSPAGPVTRDVPCNVRSYCALPHLLRLFVEVIADNSAAAEAAEYAIALEAARQEARAQFESLNIRSKSSRGRGEKGAAAAPTLSELEENCMAAVPAPHPHAPAPPSFQLVALLEREGCVARLHLTRAVLEVRPRVGLVRGSLAFELDLYVWRHSRVARLHLTSYTHILYYANGTAELFSRDAQGYRLLLGSRGSYMTEKRGTTLHVAADGTCTLRRGGVCTALPPMQLAHRVDPATGDRLCEREDGVRLRWGRSAERGGTGSWALSEVCFSNSVYLVRSPPAGRREWRVRGAPVVFCEGDDATMVSRAFGLQSGPASLRVDLATQQAHLTCTTLHGTRALLDARDYTLQVISADAQRDSVYTVDCAYGGLQADVHVAVDGGGESWRRHSYRVSAFGRCTEYRDGEQLVLPEEYVASPAQAPVYAAEVLSPAFVTALGEVTGMRSASDVEKCHQRIVAQLREGGRPSATAASSSPPAFSAGNAAGVRRAAAAVLVQDASGDEMAFMPSDALSTLLAACGGGEEGGKAICNDTQAGGEVGEWRWVEADDDAGEEVSVAAGTKTHEARSLTLPTPPPFAYYADLVARPAAQGRGWWAYRTLDPTTPLTGGQVARWLALTPAPDRDADTAPRARPAAPGAGCAHEAIAAADSSVAKAPHRRPHDAASPPADAPVPASASSDTSAARPQPSAPHADERAWCYWRSAAAPSAVAAHRTVANAGGDAGNAQGGEARSPLTPCKSAAEEAIAASAGAAAATTRHALSDGGRLPLMHSTAAKDSQTLFLSGHSAVARAAPPALSVTPLSVDFGALMPARCYGATIYLRNEGTAPCRYRVVVPAAVKAFVAVDYDHHFLAPGLTATATVHLSTLPVCDIYETALHVRHEGGSVAVALRWELSSVTTMGSARRPVGVFCVGPCAMPFQPGTTRRWRPRQAAQDEAAGDAALEDDSRCQSSSSLASASSPSCY